MKKVLLLIALIALTLPSSAWAVITADSSASEVVNGFSVGLITDWDHTTGTGATLLTLSCMVWQDVGGAGTITAATYNGSAITMATSTRSTGMYSWVGYLENPTEGTNSVGVVVTGNIDAFKCGSQTFFGTAATPLDVVSTNSSSGTTGSTNITTATDNSVVVSSISRFGTPTLTIGGSQTSIYNDVTGATGGAGGYRITTGTGTFTPSWTWTGDNDWSVSAASFKPAATPAGGDFGTFITFGDL